MRAGAVELLEREKGRDPRVPGLRRIRSQINQGPGRLRRPPAADNLPLGVKARGGIGAGQPVDEPGEVGTRQVGRRQSLQPGGAMQAMNPTWGPTYTLASPPRQLATNSRPSPPMSIPVGRGMLRKTSFVARKLAPAGRRTCR